MFGFSTHGKGTWPVPADGSCQGGTLRAPLEASDANPACSQRKAPAFPNGRGAYHDWAPRPGSRTGRIGGHLLAAASDYSSILGNAEADVGAPIVRGCAEAAVELVALVVGPGAVVS